VWGRSSRCWSRRSSRTSSPWRRGTAGTSLGRGRRKSPTPHSRAKWQVAARRRSLGMTRRRRLRWDPWQPGHGGQGEPSASLHCCRRRRHTPSWRHVGRRGSTILRPSAPPPAQLSSRRRACRVVRRRAQNVGAPTAPVASAGRSDGGTVAPKDPQYPCWRVLVSRRGLRQDCPLSPYLFVIAINELSLRL
jgi:hypothetical protein